MFSPDVHRRGDDGLLGVVVGKLDAPPAQFRPDGVDHEVVHRLAVEGGLGAHSAQQCFGHVAHVQGRHLGIVVHTVDVVAYARKDSNATDVASIRMGEPSMSDHRAVTISLHTEAIDAVTVTEVATGVSLRLGDDRSGVALFGSLDAVHRLVVEADRQLARLRCPT